MRIGRFITGRRAVPALAVVLAVSAELVAGPAAQATDWQAAGRQPPAPIYKDLPGVTPQANLKEEDSYRCHTETRTIRRRYDQIFRSGGMPALVYVCDRGGIESTGTEVPLRGHYQPVR